MRTLAHGTTRTAPPRLGVRWAFLSLLVFVTFAFAALRPPALILPYLASSSPDVLTSEEHDHPEVIGKEAELGRVSARPVHRAEPSAPRRSRGGSFQPLKASCVLAVALHAPSVALAVRVEPEQAWIPDGPTQPELMVFLN